MLFNSLTFLLVFVPLSMLGYYGLSLVGRKWEALWLVFVSFVFYTWWTASLVFLLAGSIAFNFTCGVLILRTQGREKLQTLLLALGIAGDLSLLIYYKYFFSLLNWLGYHGVLTLTHPYAVILPLGISFFTFTQVGYLIDCKGGVVKENRLLDYCLFVTFFPHLIAGPILHHREMMPQFADPRTFRFGWENMAVGLTLFIIGLAKKVVIADNLVWAVSVAFSTANPGLLAAWDGALSFSLQLYFDFSGYSDMACGLAILFGLRFPANFNSPYRAQSIIDFWQRWHMTLTRYLTLYLYNPVALAISRYRSARGKSITRKAIATPAGFLSMIALPTFYTMGLAGIWHGAGLTFLIFGLLHATYLTINHAWRSFGPRSADKILHPAQAFFVTCAKIALTYLAVVVSEVVFRATSVHGAMNLLTGMVGFHGLSGYQGNQRHLLFLASLFPIVWLMPNSLQLLDSFKPTLSKLNFDSPIAFAGKPDFTWGVAMGIMAAAVLLMVAGTTEFLYFRF
jgi:alginate O-acetyltransferase complex protein AlgI